MLGYWLRTAQLALFQRTALYAEENPEICLDISSELHKQLGLKGQPYMQAGL
jgi:hypothetical protein